MTTTTTLRTTYAHIDHVEPGCTLIMLIPGTAPINPHPHGNGEPFAGFTIWRTSDGRRWVVSADGSDLDTRSNRHGAVRLALRLAGIDRADTTRFYVTEDKEY